MMILDELWSWAGGVYALIIPWVATVSAVVNAIVCVVIVVRVLTYQRKGAAYCKWYSRAAIVIAVAFAFFPLELATGTAVTVDDTQVIINVIFMIAILRQEGNVAKLFKRNPPSGGKGGDACH